MIREEVKIWIHDISADDRSYLLTQLGGMISGSKDTPFWKRKLKYTNGYSIYIDTDTVTAATHIRIFQNLIDEQAGQITPTNLNEFIDKLKKQAKEKQDLLLQALNLPESCELSCNITIGDCSIDAEFKVPLAIIDTDLYLCLSKQEIGVVHYYLQELEFIEKALVGLSLAQLQLIRAFLDDTPMSYKDWLALQRISLSRNGIMAMIDIVSGNVMPSKVWNTYTEYWAELSESIDNKIQKLRN